MKHTILAIETATDACSVALMRAGSVYSRFQLAPREHVQLIFPMIDALLAEAMITLKDVHAIAVGRGPGSFTGVRIAMSIAQGLGFGLDIPIYGVSTLAALAYQAKEYTKVAKITYVPALDARMQEIYTAAFVNQGNILQCVSEEKVCLPQAIFEKSDSSALPNRIIAIGSGWDVYRHEIQKIHPQLQIDLIADCHPQAQHIALIAHEKIERGEKGVQAHDALPVYLRDNVAKKSTVV